jgi:C4-dicarboxylate-binding protein DctP
MRNQTKTAVQEYNMLKKLMTLSLGTVAVLASFNASASCEPGEIVIKFSHVTNETSHPKGIAASLLSDRVNKEMNGKACMEVFPNTTLYNDDQALEAILSGDLQLAAPSLSKFEKITKKFRLFDLPFLFADVAAVDRFQNSASGDILKDSMVRRGIKGLEFWHNGMKQMSASKPLLLPSDAEGLKFRVQASDVLVAQFEQLGANPQKMSFSEVYGGLQTKVIDGQENTWSNTYGKKFFEVQDGVTETNHGILDYLLVTSDDWWKGLPADVREQLGTIMSEVTQTRNGESMRVNEENKQKIIDAGGVVRTLTAEQREAWIVSLKPVWKKFEKDIGSDLLDAAIASNK